MIKLILLLSMTSIGLVVAVILPRAGMACYRDSDHLDCWRSDRSVGVASSTDTAAGTRDRL